MRILALPAFKNQRENPYNASLYTALQKLPGVTVAEFTNRRVLTERWDILHIHWPDAPLHRPSAWRAALSSGLLIARVLWAKALGAKIVWTVHNLRAHHTEYPKVEKWLWRGFVPLVNSCIHLSTAGKKMAIETFPGLAGKSHSIVPHGHYRDSYGNECDRRQSRSLLGIRGNGPVIAFVGQIKAYKNVSALVRAFFEAAHPSAILLIAGRAGDASIEADLRAVTNGHPRVFCHFGLIPDDRMHLYLNACNLTVFPYREILNSGSAILSLSFSRPTLVPSRGAMAELRQLAGEDWVYTFEGNLTGATLAAAIDQATSAERPAECELGALSWKSIASSTLAAYGRALGVERLTVFTQTALAMAHPGMEKIQ